MESGEDLLLLVGLLALVIQHIHHADEPLNQVEDSGLLPEILPQIARRVAHLAGWIACAAVMALVEGEKPRLCRGQLGSHIDEIVVYGKVCEATLEAEQRLLGVASVFVLLHRMSDVLAGDLVLQLDGEDRQAVEEDTHVERLLVGF